MVLNNYYGALYTGSDKKVYLKHWESKQHNARDKRVDTIYEKNFQTGDILIYKNVQTPGKVDGKSQTFKKENGTYYYIYMSPTDKVKINGKEYSGFIGLNGSGNLKHIDTTNYLELQNLLAKDYYVILRPAQTTSFSLDEKPSNPDPTATSSTSPSASQSSNPTDEPSASTNPSSSPTSSSSTSVKPSSSPSSSSSASTNPSSSTSSSPSASTNPSSSPSSSSSASANSSSNPSTNPSESQPGIINPSENYEITIESDIGMKNIQLYKKTASGKYVLFYKVSLNGEKLYKAKIRKSMLNSSGKTQIKIVITETNGNRELHDAQLPN